MEITEFFDDEDIEGAPADDTGTFVYYARLAGDKLNERVEGLRDIQEDWTFLNEARLAFHNYILAIGDTYNVAPFNEPTHIEVENYANKEWRAFKNVFDRRMATLIHTKMRASRSDGFLLTENAKKGIRTQLSGLRKYIAESDLPDKTKKKLLAKVDEFETALHGRTMNMAVVHAFAGGIMAYLANAATIADSAGVHKLLNGVFHVAEEAAEATQEIVALMASKPPLQITGPKPSARTQPAGPRESFSADLDDEIPF